MSEADKQTTVEAGTEFKGTLKSTCPVMVRGSLDGEIKAPSLTVAESGSVVGDVEAESIRSEGVLAGRVEADDIYLSGSVRSDTVIRAKTLEVKLKQERGKLEVTFGDCILEVGDEPSAEAQVAPEETAKAGGAMAFGAMEAAGDDASKGKKKKNDDGKKSKVDDAASDSSNGKSVPPPA